jgi:hypothetical protein
MRTFSSSSLWKRNSAVEEFHFWCFLKWVEYEVKIKTIWKAATIEGKIFNFSGYIFLIRMKERLKRRELRIKRTSYDKNNYANGAFQWIYKRLSISL